MSENISLRGLLRAAPAAERAGLTTSTWLEYHRIGIVPPAVLRIGSACFWSVGDIDFFKRSYTGRPASRYSFKGRKAK